MRIVKQRVRDLGTIPLQEVSGLSLARHSGRSLVVAVGDRSTTVAWSLADRGSDTLRWQTEVLPDDALGGSGSPQLEAVAADGGSGVLLVQEWPNRALLLDIEAQTLQGVLDLVIDPDLGELGQSWQDPDCSHTEGALMLRDGHLLVLKEKDPAALLEFGPAGASPLGFAPERWLDDGETWPLPGPELHLLAAWSPDRDLARACPDFSDLAQGRSGELVILSDQGESVALVDPIAPAAEPLAGVLTAQTVWTLRGISGKPEGICVLPDGEVLVSVDRKGIKENLYLLPSEAWDA